MGKLRDVGSTGDIDVDIFIITDGPKLQNFRKYLQFDDVKRKERKKVVLYNTSPAFNV